MTDFNTAKHRWPAMLVQLLDNAVTTATQCGLNTEQAEQLALAIISNQAKLFGGLQVYLPKGDDLARAMRDREIYKQAGRVDVATLARQHNISMKQIWEIQRTQRALHIKSIQPTLL